MLVWPHKEMSLRKVCLQGALPREQMNLGPYAIWLLQPHVVAKCYLLKWEEASPWSLLSLTILLWSWHEESYFQITPRLASACTAGKRLGVIVRWLLCPENHYQDQLLSSYRTEDGPRSSIVTHPAQPWCSDCTEKMYNQFWFQVLTSF